MSEGDAFGNPLARTAWSAHRDWTSPTRGYCWGCRPKATTIPKSNLTLECISWWTFALKWRLTPTFAFSVGSSRPHEAQVEAGGHSGGLKAAEVPRRGSSLHQRPEEGEGVRSEVDQMDDMAGWTRVTSLFAGRRNICKSQMTVMTPWLYDNRLG
jgi:hypothetical protein